MLGKVGHGNAVSLPPNNDERCNHRPINCRDTARAGAGFLSQFSSKKPRTNLFVLIIVSNTISFCKYLIKIADICLKVS